MLSVDPKWRGAPGPGAAPWKAPPSPSPNGTQGGPGILEDRYNAVATGTDPGMEYAMGHGTALLNRASAARGGFNSSAAFQGLGSLYGTETLQHEQRIDQLAAGASGEHAGNVGQSIGLLGTIASGTTAAAQPYGMAAGDAQKQAAADKYQSDLIKAGVDPATAAQKTKDAFGLANLGISAAKVG